MAQVFEINPPDHGPGVGPSSNCDVIWQVLDILMITTQNYVSIRAGFHFNF